MTSDRMRLVAPDLDSRRARLADWIELLALSGSQNGISLSQVRSLARRMGDGRTRATDIDADADDVGEPEITDRLSEDLEEKISEELAFRQGIVGAAYPFVLVTENGGRSQRLILRETWTTPETGELIYIFCLLDSGFRDGLIECPVAARPIINSIGNVFQICACIAIGGYTNAEVVSFGFPRATGDSFLPALQNAWRRYGSFEIRQRIDHGWDQKLKDGGIDIIAWRHFSDRFAATFIMFAQVASGLDWKDKEVSGDVRALKKWFDGSTFEHFLPAICIPFPLWFDLDEPAKDDNGGRVAYNEGIKNRFAIREGKYGVIFDRGRIALASASALKSAASEQLSYPIDGIDRVGEVGEWIELVMSKFAMLRDDA